jgi:hypothetical protein
LEKYKSKALLQAFTTRKIIRAAGNAGEEILRAAEREREKNGYNSNGQQRA